jgi:hypothetical protein
MGTGDGKSASNQNPSIKYLSEDGGACRVWWKDPEPTRKYT